LAKPKAVRGYYRDVKVLAFPVPAKDRAVDPSTIQDLSDKLDAKGRLHWDVPAGDWGIERIGCTTTGVTNKPSPVSGQGLECDKFNPDAMRLHFDSLIGKLIGDVGEDAAKVFTTTHIDSWEVGTQDWTGRMEEEFAKRRGYALAPWLVALTGE